MDSSNMCTCAEHLAMASVPKQEWCEPYDIVSALAEGTIFPCLNLTFYKAPEGKTKLNSSSSMSGLSEKNREEMMSELSAFAGKFYPLTQASIVTGDFDKNRYGWSEGPMPWEGACI